MHLIFGSINVFFFSVYPTVMTSPEFLSVTKLLAMVMMTGSMIYENEYKCLARHSSFLIVMLLSSTTADLHAPLVGRAGGQPGPHTGEFLSPLEWKHFVCHSSLNVLVCHGLLTSLMGLKEPLDEGVKIEEEELKRTKVIIK